MLVPVHQAAMFAEHDCIQQVPQLMHHPPLLGLRESSLAVGQLLQLPIVWFNLGVVLAQCLDLTAQFSQQGIQFGSVLFLVVIAGVDLTQSLLESIQPMRQKAL
jgi:hypothetical protein